MKIKLEGKELFDIQDVVVTTKSSVVEYVKYSSKRRKEKQRGEKSQKGEKFG